MKRLKVLFVHTNPPGQLSSFVQQDLDLLSAACDVEAMQTPSYVRRPLGTRKLWAAVQRNDVVFAWFATCAPALMAAAWFRRPSVVVVGGSDVVSMPEIGYGPSAQRFDLFRAWVRFGLRLATRILPFSEASGRSLAEQVRLRPGQARTLYLGVDTAYFSPDPATAAKQPHALSMGYIKDSNLLRKGLWTFREAARCTPDVAFRLGGKPVEAETVARLTEPPLPNFTYLGYLDDAQLLAEYRRAKVYAQLSAHEGFGLALAEAMACECIPVVTAQGAIPEVVGDTGLYVPVGDAAAAGAAIRRALRESDPAAGARARSRITELFPLAKRQAGLLQVLAEAVAATAAAGKSR